MANFKFFKFGKPLISTIVERLIGDLHAYLSLQTSTGNSHLHQVSSQPRRLSHRSISALATRNHRSWISTLFHDFIAKNLPRPTTQSLLLMGFSAHSWTRH